MELTTEQQEIVASGGNVRVSLDGLECVVLRSDIFDRASKVLNEDWTHDEMRFALARSSEENGWDDPEMSIYDEQYP